MTAIRQNFRMSVWAYVVAGSFLAYYTVMVYSELYRPLETGISYQFSNGVMQVTTVAPSSPASRAGVKSGDHLVAVDGRPIQTWEDWRSFLDALAIGRKYVFEVEHAGLRSEVHVTIERQPGDPLGRLERKRYVQALLLLLALILVHHRPSQRVAQIGAWLLAAIGTAPLFPHAEMTAVWRGLPKLLGVVLWIPQISHVMLLPLFFTFFAILPRPLFQARWPWVLVWTPALMVAAWWTPLILDHVYRPRILADPPAWMRFVLGLAVLVYLGGGLLALLLSYRRLSEPQEGRRLRVLVVGAVIGLAPVVPFLAAIFWGTLTQSPLVWFFVSDPYRHSLVGLFLAFPVSLTYAILRHGVLDFPPRRPVEVDI